MHKDAPHVLKNAPTAPIFKKTTLSLDEEAILIKQLICEEDEALENAQSSSCESEEVIVKTNKVTQTVKKHDKKDKGKKILKTEKDTGASKKKRQNRNGKLGINKNNNYAYVPNAPRKVCQNCASTNHLTYACKKPSCDMSKFGYDCNVPLMKREYSYCDKFDCMPCNMNIMNSCYNLRQQFMYGCTSHMAHTHIHEPLISPKAGKKPVSPKSKSPTSKTVKGDKAKKDTLHNMKDKASVSKIPGPNSSLGTKEKVINLWLQGTGKKMKVVWIVDSGCSRHMTGDKALLSHFEERAGPLVTFGDDSIGTTMGYGKLECGNVIIEDIALVKGLKHNLLSVSQFTDRGFKVEFDEDCCLITNKKTSELALSGVRKGSLFVADLGSTNKDKICCFYTKASKDECMLWHKKLSHLNFKAIDTLVKRELVRGMPAHEFKFEGVCEACQKGKIKRSSHKSKSVSSITKPL